MIFCNYGGSPWSSLPDALSWMGGAQGVSHDHQLVDHGVGQARGEAQEDAQRSVEVALAPDRQQEVA